MHSAWSQAAFSLLLFLFLFWYKVVAFICKAVITIYYINILKKEAVLDVYLYKDLIHKSEKNECIPGFEEKKGFFFFPLGRGTVFIFWSLPEGVKL